MTPPLLAVNGTVYREFGIARRILRGLVEGLKSRIYHFTALSCSRWTRVHPLNGSQRTPTSRNNPADGEPTATTYHVFGLQKIFDLRIVSGCDQTFAMIRGAA